MNEIKCPKCGTVFQIDESDYESIVKQIKDKEFEHELLLIEEQHKKDKESAIKLAEANKEMLIQELQLELKNKEQQTQNKLEKNIKKN